MLFFFQCVIIIINIQSFFLGLVTFTSDTTKGPCAIIIEADPKNVIHGDFIPKLAARAMIRFVSDDIG
jgi:hypothetical protein